MAHYKMPDGNIYDVDSPEEADQLYDSFPKDDAKKTSYKEDITAGVAGSLGTIAGGLSGLAKLGAVPEQFFTGDVKHTTEASDYLAEQSARLKKEAGDISKDQSFGGKVVSMVAGLPALPETLATSPFDVQGEMLNAGESGLRASAAGELTAAANLAGLKLPAALGKGLVTRVASGAGIGAAQDVLSKGAISNIAETPEMQKQFAPSWESAGLAAIPGAAIGAGVHVADRLSGEPTPKPKGEEVPEPTVDRGSPEQIKAYLEQNEKDVVRTEYKIQQIQDELKTAQFETPEQAEQYHAARLEEIQAHQEVLNDLAESKANAEAMLRGETPTPRGQEQPTGQPPRPEGEDFVRPEEAPVSPEQSAQADMFDTEGQPTKEAEVSQEQPTIGAEKTPEQLGTDPSIKVEEAPVEEITTKPIEQMSPAEFGDRTALENELANTDISTPEGAQKFKDLSEQLTAMNKPEPTGIHIEGATHEEQAAVHSILEEVGLDKERIDMLLNEHNMPEGNLGLATSHDGTALIRVAARKTFSELVDSIPVLKEMAGKLGKDQIANFEKLVTTAHEVGHVLLWKLIQTDLYKSELNTIISQYDKWKADQPSHAGAAAQLHFGMSKTGVEYFSQFPEFFAQRVARNLVIKTEKPSGPIAKFISDYHSVVDKLKKVFKVSINADNMVDTFIKKIIADNKVSLEQTGKTIFEMVSVKDSLEGARLTTDIKFNYRSLDEIEKGLTRSGTPTNKSAMPSPVQNAVRNIENAEEVIKQMEGIPDANPIASKVTFWRFGIQQRAGIYGHNPIIKYASDVVLNSLHVQTQRSMELLAGVTDKATYLAKKGFGVTLQKIKENGSPSVVFNKASNEDFHAVQQVLEKGIGRYSYEESLAQFGADLTPQQKTLFTVATKMYARMYEMAAKQAGELGKKSIIPNMKGWYPAVRKGEFTVNFHIEGLKRLAGTDEMGRTIMTDLVHSQSFRTEGEAQAFIKHFEAQSPEFKGMLRHNGVEHMKEPEGVDQLADFHRAYQEQRAKLREDQSSLDSGTAPKWLKEEAAKFDGDMQAWLDHRMQRMVDMYTARGGALGGHHKFRTNVSGSMGSEMFATVHDAGKAFRDANYKSVDEFTGLMQKMDIEEKLNLLINNEELMKSHPNSVEFTRLTRDYALNRVESPLAFKGAKASIDAIWEAAWKKTPLHKLEVFGAKKYQDAPVVDIAMRKMGSLFYIHALMSRPFFWGAQSVQFLWAGRTMLKDNVGPIGATVSAGKGFWQVVRPDREFMEALYHVSQTSHTFSPQFVKDINSHALGDFLQEGSKTRLLFELITGEKQSTAADTFSRLMSFGMMYEHFKEQGFRGEELARKAADATDENMVQYGRQYKAPMFQKMGMIGDLVSPLHTFTSAALGNLVTDAGAMLRAPGGKAKLQASLPFMATVAMTGLMTGILGTPMVAEYEFLRLLINKLSNAVGGEDLLPSVVDWALSGDNTFSNRVVSHGLLSASTMPATDNQGLDIGASNRWQPVFDGITQGQDTFMSFLPVINWYVQRAGDVGTLVGNATGISPASDAERRTAAMNITPGWYKGVVDDLLFGAKDREMVPDAKGHAFLPQTKTERAAKYLGGSTISSSVERLRERRMKEQEMRDQPKIDNLVLRIADSVQAKDMATVQKLAVKLNSEYMVPEKVIESRVDKELTKRKIPKGMLQFTTPKGTMSSQQQARYLNYKEKYGTPDLSQYQQEE